MASKYGLAAPLASMQAAQTFSNGASASFMAADPSGNKTSTSATATVTKYSGPVVTPSTATTCANNTVTMTTSGMAPAGNYLSTNGASDYVSLPNNAVIGSNWTLESWVKFPLVNTGGTGNWNTLFRGPSGNHQVIVSTQGTKKILGTYLGGFYAAGTFNGSVNTYEGFDLSTLTTGWHHLAITGTGGVTTFYVDGINVGKANVQSTESIFAIGNYQGGSQQIGGMDEVSIWNTALPQTTINTWMTKAITPSHPNYATLLFLIINLTAMQRILKDQAPEHLIVEQTLIRRQHFIPRAPLIPASFLIIIILQKILVMTGPVTGTYNVIASANTCTSTTSSQAITINPLLISRCHDECISNLFWLYRIKCKSWWWKRFSYS